MPPDEGDGEDDEDDEDDEIVLPEVDPSNIGHGGGLFVDRTNLDLRHSVFITNRAAISGGGLYTAGTVQTPPSVFNTLFAGNTAGHDGGGASVNWDSRMVFSNCTFADNQATGYGTDELYTAGSGGGLYVAYNSIVDVLDSIFWSNNAAQGAQITVSAGSLIALRPSTLNIAYSNVQALGGGGIFRDQDCIVNTGDGMLGNNTTLHEPRFVAPDGVEEDDVHYQYYLNTGSPSIDAGSTPASALGLTDFTTHIFGNPDRGVVDQGYHYRIAFKTDCSRADVFLSGRVDLADFAEIASRWMESECYDGDLWCTGTDLNFDGFVDIYDLLTFTPCWLEEDTESPLPNPSVWAVEPIALPDTFTEMEMEAVATHDAWWPDEYIMYYFEAVDRPDLNVGPGLGVWRFSPQLSLDGLTPGGEITFRVKARDGSGNETDWSDAIVQKAGQNTFPTPNPAEFVEDTPYVSGPYTVRMEAVPYNGPALPAGVRVEYRFLHVFPSAGAEGSGSGWQVSPIYEESGLEVDSTYVYSLRMRFYNYVDGFQISQTDEARATILMTEPDITPPDPDPAQFQADYPFQGQVNNQWFHIMVAEPATDDGGAEHENVEYKFRAYSALEGGSLVYESSWQNLANSTGTFPDGRSRVERPHEHWRFVGAPGIMLYWTVQYRDMGTPPNMTEESERTPLQQQQ